MMSKKLTDVVAYLSWIGLLIAFVAGDRENCKFHLNQSLVIWLAGVVLGVVAIVPILAGLWPLLAGFSSSSAGSSALSVPPAVRRRKCPCWAASSCCSKIHALLRSRYRYIVNRKHRRAMWLGGVLFAARRLFFHGGAGGSKGNIRGSDTALTSGRKTDRAGNRLYCTGAETAGNGVRTQR